MAHSHEHAHPHPHEHPHEHPHRHEHQTGGHASPDPAIHEILEHMRERGMETAFDRFAAQKPQCGFGISGVCCRNCVMGPCRVTPKSPRGVCGANADVIVARNLLRSLAAAVSAHGARSREVMLALKATSEKRFSATIQGTAKVKAIATAFGLKTRGKSIERLAGEVASVLLEDLSRSTPDKHRTLHALAPKERLAVWGDLGILPIGAYHEVFEALHRTTTGTDGSWENIMQQFLRCGLAFGWSSVTGGAIAMDCLYGPPRRSTVTANLGTLTEGTVNIALHGHSPVLVSAVVAASRRPELLDYAKAHGAKGINLYGICCSGLSAMYRYGDIHPLANAMGAELVLATGALDLWVADMQDVFPTIMDVANCCKTKVVTTSDSCHLPGAEHHGFDHDHTNLHEAEALADLIVRSGIERHAERIDVPRVIPQHSTEAEIGFSVENVFAAFGGAKALADHIQSGRIRGVVNVVGCNNPKVPYEQTVLDVVDILLAENVLVLTNGCASFPLLKLGYCRRAAVEKAGAGLREALSGNDLPPVLHMGECLDNARASGLFRAVADAAGHAIREMPYAFASPEWSNEKGIGAALSFRLMGVSSYHCIAAPVAGSDNVLRFLSEGTAGTLGAVMVTIRDPRELARKMIDDLGARRAALGWSAIRRSNDGTTSPFSDRRLP